MNTDVSQPSEQHDRSEERHSDDVGERAFGTDENKQHIQSPKSHTNKENEVYQKPIVEPLDQLPFSTRDGKTLEKGNIVSDESLNPYKNKREDRGADIAANSSPNPYKHKSKWVYAPIDAAVPSVNNKNNVQVPPNNFGYPANQWVQDQQAMEAQQASRQMDWQQHQDAQQQMQLEAQQQMMMQLNQQQQMQLQAALMQQQNQQPFVFNPNAQNFLPPNFEFYNNNGNNLPCDNNGPNFGNSGPNFPFNNQSPFGNGPNSTNWNGPNFGNGGPGFGPNFGNNAPFFGNEQPGFGNNQGFANNNQMQMPAPGPFPLNQQMRMPFPPNMAINWNGPPPAPYFKVFFMQNPNSNGMDFIGDAMRNPEFDNRMPVRF
ncbi:hypothetical protein Tcan_16945 [Toxocara canis]|uniref:Uncharacterized protein n=1 Tax=Toxocara canis TaxID=6265 RepID=A0A0B2VKU6_TOXCA|nr:hypothetical protein Tcan_16945 [Toxocara canis]